jgi:vWA-MoxR associated protein C-terminal domain/vWA-MoxR associated protein middle region (VMAP-M) 1
LQNAKIGEDIALLKLNRYLSPQEVKPVELTPVENPWGHKFNAYGFPSDSDSGVPTKGELCPLQANRWIYLKVDADQCPIEGGFSGAPLWDNTVMGVVGMIIAAKDYDDSNRVKEEAFAIPSSILKKNWLRQGKLIELLEPFEESLKKPIQRAYNACRPATWNAEQPTTLTQIVGDLNDLDDRDSTDREYSHLVEFATRLVAKEGIAYTLRQQLQMWVESTFELNGSEFAQLCDRVAKNKNPISSQEQVPQSSLLISIHAEEVRDRYKIEAWSIEDTNTYQSTQLGKHPEQLDDDSGYSFTELAAQMPRSISNLLDRVFDAIEGELQIEIFVPFEILHLAPDSWEYEMDWDIPRPIGCHCPVVLRVWDRLGYKKIYKKAFASKWQQRWKRQQQYQSYCCSNVLVCSDRSDDEISRDWNTEVAIGLRKTKTPNPAKGGLFSFIMVEGVPIALWVRRDLEACCSGEKYQELLDAPLSELPQKLKIVRKAPCDRATHIGHHLSLLWDNPDLIPPDAPLYSNAGI